MKVRFLRNYGKNKIGEEKEIDFSEVEQKYLLDTHTIKIIEDYVVEIPKIEVETDGGKASKKSRATK